MQVVLTSMVYDSAKKLDADRSGVSKLEYIGEPLTEIIKTTGSSKLNKKTSDMSYKRSFTLTLRFQFLLRKRSRSNYCGFAAKGCFNDTQVGRCCFK